MTWLDDAKVDNKNKKIVMHALAWAISIKFNHRKFCMIHLKFYRTRMLGCCTDFLQFNTVWWWFNDEMTCFSLQKRLHLNKDYLFANKQVGETFFCSLWLDKVRSRIEAFTAKTNHLVCLKHFLPRAIYVTWEILTIKYHSTHILSLA